MSIVPTNVSFNDWVRNVFDHPVTEISEAWYRGVDSDSFDPNSMRLVEYSSKLFEESADLLKPYTDEQVDQGLWFLVGTSELDIMGTDVVPLKDRLRCIRSIFTLFERCFEARCTPHLSHIDWQSAGPMNSICYMWWDLLWYPIKYSIENRLHDSNTDEVVETCISVMESILELPSPASQESALHGLGHWGSLRQERCRCIIASFLERHQELSPKLRAYALKAQETKVS